MEYFVKEDLGPNWVRWMVAVYFNDKESGERTPEKVKQVYSRIF